MIYIAAVDISTLDETGYLKLYHLASRQRQQKADRYLRKEDARRCIVADGLLRFAMRQSLGTDRRSISQTPKGKPFLPDQDSFHFNLSHSGNWVVIAWGDRPVGIDVEMIDLDEGKEQLIPRYFRSDEQDYVFAVNGPDRANRFFEIWTKKESYLKYLGIGITRSLSSFSVLEPMDVNFYTQLLTNATLTLCTEALDYQIIPVTVDMLLSV